MHTLMNFHLLLMLDDKKLIDEDMKSVLINRMETLEPEDELENKYLTTRNAAGSCNF